MQTVSKQCKRLAITSLSAMTLACMMFLLALPLHSFALGAASVIPCTLSLIYAIKADNELKRKYRNPVR